MAIYLDDRQLVAAHQAGDSEAFDELVREYRQPLIAHAHRKLHCASAAEDAFQETLVRAYRALPNFEGQYRLGPWLHRIMANVCIDEANRRLRDGEKAEKLAAQPATRRTAPGPEDELGLDLDASHLDLALEALSEPQKEALLLRFVDDLEYEEVAAISGVSEQNARARVSRARAVMRSAMKGVAALPVLFLGLLKRGEKAAAAAATGGGAVATGTGGSTAATLAAQTAPATAMLPTLAEASTAVAQAAPTVVPVIAKAAVGIGLAAAILTPTSDSALHMGAEAISKSPEVVSSPDVDVVEQLVSEEAATTLGNGEGAVVVAREAFEAKMSAAMGPSATEEVSGSSPDGEILTGGGRGNLLDETETAKAVAAVSAEHAVELLGSDLRFHPAGGGRYDVVGDVTVQTESLTFVATVDESSRLSLVAETGDDDVMRAELLLSFATPDWGLTEIRVAGLVSETPTASWLVGFFRSSPNERNALADRGSVTGELLVGPQGSMALKLTP